MDSMNSGVIFDLGNVILPFDHMKPCHTLSKKVQLSGEEIYTIIFGSGLQTEFEMGLLGGTDFHARCEELLNCNIDYEDFRYIWTDIFEQDKDVIQIIEELKPHTKLILLSNTNEWHFEHVKMKFPVISLFDDYILSYQVGAMKPDQKIFEAGLRKVSDCDRVVYIDDIAEYIEAASSHGIKGHVFQSAKNLRAFLGENGFF